MYFITVSNGLLDGDHQKKMGSSVWQFMWCLDKITVINEKGEGKVLGGRPVKLEEIGGASRITISRNLNKLEKLGYIKLTHAPYGIIIIVYKAKKIFGNRIIKNDKPNRIIKSDKPLDKNDKPNKTIHINNTDKDIKKNMKTINYDTGEVISSKKTKLTKEQNNLIISLGILWANLIKNELKLEDHELPIRNVNTAIRNAYLRYKLSYKEFEELFKEWIKSAKPEEKHNFYFCMSEQNIVKFKIKYKEKQTEQNIKNLRRM